MLSFRWRLVKFRDCWEGTSSKLICVDFWFSMKFKFFGESVILYSWEFVKNTLLTRISHNFLFFLKGVVDFINLLLVLYKVLHFRQPHGPICNRILFQIGHILLAEWLEVLGDLNFFWYPLSHLFVSGLNIPDFIVLFHHIFLLPLFSSIPLIIVSHNSNVLFLTLR